MAKKVYIISDLHGHYQVFMKLLEKIQFRDEDDMYILGDVCDRGPQSLDIYFEIFKRKNIQLIKGNHEIMMRESLLKDNDTSTNQFRMWMENGGRKTIENYHQYLNKKNISEAEYKKVRATFLADMIRFVNDCPSFIEVIMNKKKYVLIHAGINPEKGLYDQTEEECAWMREYFYMSKGLEGKKIIFGHTPTCFLHGEQIFDIWEDPIFHDKIGIDGGLGSFEGGQINCICLNDMSITTIKKSEVYSINENKTYY